MGAAREYDKGSNRKIQLIVVSQKNDPVFGGIKRSENKVQT
jgi:hypothetical protein